jgi:hypothetical protein
MGLALKAFVKAIKKITAKRKLKPVLFYWGYSKEGKKLSIQISKVLKFKIRERKD